MPKISINITHNQDDWADQTLRDRLSNKDACLFFKDRQIFEGVFPSFIRVYES